MVLQELGIHKGLVNINTGQHWWYGIWAIHAKWSMSCNVIHTSEGKVIWGGVSANIQMVVNQNAN